MFICPFHGLTPPVLTASATPSSVSGSGTSAGTVSTNAATLTIAGGVPPYNVSWAAPAGWSASPSGAGNISCSFSKSMGASEDASGTGLATITDMLGAVATVNVPASLHTEPAFSASVSPSSYWPPSPAPAGSVFSTSFTANYANNPGPVSFSWSVVSGSGVTITSTSTLQSVTVDVTMAGSGGNTATLQCLVTSGGTTIAASALIIRDPR